MGNSVKKESIAAYDLLERVENYDRDMDIMHPNRRKMVETALEFIPFNRDKALHVLDLGSGTGYFSGEMLKEFPNCTITAVDGAQSMIELSRVRLKEFESRTRYFVGDFRKLTEIVPAQERFDVVLSSYALHHLEKDEKRDVAAQAVSLLNPEGWFLNADLIINSNAAVEKRIQELRIDGIVGRAGGADSRFRDTELTRTFIDDLESNEDDKPLSIFEDLEILRESGLGNVSVLWLEHREVVICGQK